MLNPSIIPGLMMEPEKDHEQHRQCSHQPIRKASQALNIAQRRTQFAIAHNMVIAMARDAIALNNHTLLFAAGVQLITDITLAALALTRIKIVGNQIG